MHKRYISTILFRRHNIGETMRARGPFTKSWLSTRTIQYGDTVFPVQTSIISYTDERVLNYIILHVTTNSFAFASDRTFRPCIWHGCVSLWHKLFTLQVNPRWWWRPLTRFPLDGVVVGDGNTLALLDAQRPTHRPHEIVAVLHVDSVCVTGSRNEGNWSLANSPVVQYTHNTQQSTSSCTTVLTTTVHTHSC